MVIYSTQSCSSEIVGDTRLTCPGEEDFLLSSYLNVDVTGLLLSHFFTSSVRAGSIQKKYSAAMSDTISTVTSSFFIPSRWHSLWLESSEETCCLSLLLRVISAGK